MKYSVAIEKVFRQSINKVWEGLISRESLSAWLMETDNFEPKLGCKFELYCVDEMGHRDEYQCKVLALEPPKRMLWSWVLASDEDQKLTQVEFELEAANEGTKITILHSSDLDREVLERFRDGWPHKLDNLLKLLSR